MVNEGEGKQEKLYTRIMHVLYKTYLAHENNTILVQRNHIMPTAVVQWKHH